MKFILEFKIFCCNFDTLQKFGLGYNHYKPKEMIPCVKGITILHGKDGVYDAAQNQT